MEDNYVNGAIAFPLCGLDTDIDYLDCELANNFNNLSDNNTDLDLDIETIED